MPLWRPPMCFVKPSALCRDSNPWAPRLCAASASLRGRDKAKWDAAGAPLVSRQRSRTTSHSAARCVTHLLDVKNENIDGCNLQGSGVAEETGWLNGRDVAKRCAFATAAAAVIDTVISIAVEQQVRWQWGQVLMITRRQMERATWTCFSCQTQISQRDETSLFPLHRAGSRPSELIAVSAFLILDLAFGPASLTVPRAGLFNI